MEPFQTLRELAEIARKLGDAGDRFEADTVLNVLHAWDVARDRLAEKEEPQPCGHPLWALLGGVCVRCFDQDEIDKMRMRAVTAERERSEAFGRIDELRKIVAREQQRAEDLLSSNSGLRASNLEMARRVEKMDRECASISEEFGLPPTIRPADGEIRRILAHASGEPARIAKAVEADRERVQAKLRDMATKCALEGRHDAVSILYAASFGLRKGAADSAAAPPTLWPYPAGTPVLVRRSDGVEFAEVTFGPAVDLDGRTYMPIAQGTGCSHWALEYVRIDPSRAPAPGAAKAAKPTSLKIVFVVNGEEVPIEAQLVAPLQIARNEALVQSQTTGRPQWDWEVRTESGVLLEPELKIGTLNFADGVRLFLTPRTGSGGAAPAPGVEDEAHALLRRIVKYATEDRAQTPHVTRLARAVEEARTLLAKEESP